MIYNEVNQLKIYIPPCLWGFPDSSVGKEPTCNATDPGSIPELGRSPREGIGYPLQYFGLENSMDYIGHGVAKSWTWLGNFHFHFCSWTSLPIPIPPIQVITEHSAELPVLHSRFPLAIYFTHSSVYMSILFSHLVPLSPSPTASSCLFSMSVSLFLPWK